MKAIKFNFGSNVRTYKPSQVVELANAFYAGTGWLPSSVILTHGKGDCDIQDAIAECFPTTRMEKGKEVEAKYTLGGKGYTVAGMQALCNGKGGKTALSIVDGKGRGLAYMLYIALCERDNVAVSVEPNTVEVDPAKVGNLDTLSLTANIGHDYVNRLTRGDAARHVLTMVDDGRVTSEADVMRLGFRRGMAQTVWSLVQCEKKHGITVDTLAATVGTTAANFRAIANTVNTAEAVEAANKLAAVGPEVKHKALPGDKVGELVDYATGNNAAANVVDLLTAIRVGNHANALAALRSVIEAK